MVNKILKTSDSQLSTDHYHRPSCAPPLTSAFSMSEDHPLPEDNVNRRNALQLANRKKPCIWCHPATQMNVLINDFWSDVRGILSFTTDDILVERYMPCAVSMPWLPALLRVCAKMRTSNKSHLHSSSCNGFIPSLNVNASLLNIGLRRSTGYIKSSHNWYLISLSVS